MTQLIGHVLQRYFTYKLNLGRLWFQSRGFGGEMSLCFIQLAHKVPLLVVTLFCKRKQHIMALTLDSKLSSKLLHLVKGYYTL